jgi:DNA-binding NtrC family response regulator
MVELLDTIRQAAPTQATVMITGETGSGKELVAQAIHRLSARAKGPFVAVHCAALTTTILESELFGHEKGAFTGAVARRRGRFEMADGGTLFLDEVSEIDASIQVKLLRVLEERRFERVGGSESVDVDIRLIAATNRDLRERVAQGLFREDLFFRLDVVNVHIAPLRERSDDIPLLCSHFLAECSSRDGRPLQGITAETCNILSAYAWPGNVRELRNTIEKMVVLSKGGALTPRDIPRNIRDAVRDQGYRFSGGARRAPLSAADTLADAERRMIELALERDGGNVTRAASALGISRRTLHRKLHAYRERRQPLSDGDAAASKPQEA